MAGKGPHLHAGQQASISLEAPQARPRVPRLVVHGSTMLRAYFRTNLVGTLLWAKGTMSHLLDDVFR